MHHILQFGIMTLGLIALVIVTSATTRRARRIGCVVGLCGQPFWILSAWQAQQWGMLALSIVYTAVWAHGAWRP